MAIKKISYSVPRSHMKSSQTDDEIMYCLARAHLIGVVTNKYGVMVE
jgi:hypothetical protein